MRFATFEPVVQSFMFLFFFDFFNAYVGYYRADGATHSTTVHLFLDGVVKNKVVIGEHEIQ